MKIYFCDALYHIFYVMYFKTTSIDLFFSKAHVIIYIDAIKIKSLQYVFFLSQYLNEKYEYIF